MYTPKILTVLSETTEGTSRIFLNTSYEVAINTAGGMILGIGRPSPQLSYEEIFMHADGLLLVGGHDINPKLFSEKNTHSKHIRDDRDTLEIGLLMYAIKENIPTLGICRGAQIINVAQGGSLYQDIQRERSGSIKHDFHTDINGADIAQDCIAHDVHIETGTKLQVIIGQSTIPVNSLHHQGIKKLGSNLIPVAFSPDGLIEAIEIMHMDFGIGVEWHPETLCNDDASQKLFSAFIVAAKKYRDHFHMNKAL